MLAGPFWYLVPCALVVLLGLATCSLVDVTEYDTFEVEGSVADAGGFRHAVLVRYVHADTSLPVKCIWIVAGPAPSTGPTRRLAEACALIATDPTARLGLIWQANGRLKVVLPEGMARAGGDVADEHCFFAAGKLPARACYSTIQIDVEAAGGERR